MPRKARILGIAPYESLRTLMQDVAAEYDNVELTVFVGDMEQGLEAARRNFYNDYDLILSRGGTADLLRRKIDLPVVEVPITTVDFLRAVRMAENISRHIDIVGKPNFLKSIEPLVPLLPYDIRIITVTGTPEAEEALQKIGHDKDRVILGDRVVQRVAAQMGIGMIFLASGAEAMRSAFDEALRVCGNFSALRSQNDFLRDLVWSQINKTVVFDEKKDLMFSSLSDNTHPLVEYLREECDLIAAEGDKRLIKQINHVQYNIRATRRELDGMQYVAYYFSENRAPSGDQQRGIRYINSDEALREYNGGLYGTAGLMQNMRSNIEHVIHSGQPVMIWGEQGTCKEQMADYIYLQSESKNNPLVVIDCFLLNNKTWEYLTDSHNSPLLQNNITLFLKSVDALNEDRKKSLLTGLLAMDIGRRSRVIVSCSCSDDRMSELGGMFVEKMGCIPLYLPPMRSYSDRISAAAGLYLSHVNLENNKQVLGFESGALEPMQEFGWPGNHTQFMRIIRELSYLTDTPYISRAAVSEILKREQVGTHITEKETGAALPLDLNRSLNEINHDIILKVLDEEAGNQSSAARRLGISRTTMWRFLNNGS